MNRLFFDNSIGQLIEKFSSGALSPGEAAAASLENVRELDPKYFAWVAGADGEWPARVQAVAERFGIRPEKLFEFVPVGIKDIYNTRDFPTQMGSLLWKDFTPGNDARPVYNLKREGAVIAGKTVTAEFAVHALEKTLNPYDITKTPGTSSSGSAVAVSLGMVPFATGSQTAGSIVRPASFCGVYGMKPSFGFIPRTGTLKTTDSLDTLGFFALHASDLRRGFDSMRVHGLNYPISHAAISDGSRQHKPEGRPWRVALAKTHTWDGAPQYARDALLDFAKRLSAAGVEVVEAALPEASLRAHDVHRAIYNKTLSYYFDHEYEKAEFVSPVMNELIADGKMISPEAYFGALKEQNGFIYAMDEMLSGFDALISLSTSSEAPPREQVELPDPALMWTLAHLPAVSAPAFRSPAGLPFGVQLCARKYNDYLLLEFLDHLVEQGLLPARAGYGVDHEK